MNYTTVREAAKKWGISERRVLQLCKEGRIQGVRRFGRPWMIPDDANKPGELRRGPRKQKSQRDGSDTN